MLRTAADKKFNLLITWGVFEHNNNWQLCLNKDVFEMVRMKMIWCVDRRLDKHIFFSK
jgi:hypothetical protein